MDNELSVYEQNGAVAVKAQVNQIQHLMKEVLQEGTHYGVVPGCGDKKNLLLPGAEKIALMFGFIPSYEVTPMQLSGGHREYDVTCTLTNKNGEAVGTGVGLCSSMESKYRWRKDRSHKDEHGNPGKIENPDIADVLNTVLKIAKKRAFVDAVKSTTAASDIFTQDLDEEPASVGATPIQQPVVPQQPVEPDVIETPASTSEQKISDSFAEFMHGACQQYVTKHGGTVNIAAKSIIAACGNPLDAEKDKAVGEYMRKVSEYIANH